MLARLPAQFTTSKCRLLITKNASSYLFYSSKAIVSSDLFRVMCLLTVDLTWRRKLDSEPNSYLNRKEEQELKQNPAILAGDLSGLPGSSPHTYTVANEV